MFPLAFALRRGRCRALILLAAAPARPAYLNFDQAPCRLRALHDHPAGGQRPALGDWIVIDRVRVPRYGERSPSPACTSAGWPSTR